MSWKFYQFMLLTISKQPLNDFHNFINLLDTDFELNGTDFLAANAYNTSTCN